jgi:FMN phosphatase YigB (HAD superfamily)
MIVCFDYDGTLDDVRLQALAKKLIRERNEVYIVTARTDNDFNKKALKPMLDKIGMSEHSVFYCSHKPKLETLKMLNADIYFDNIEDEFEAIKNYTNTIPVLWSSR